MLCPLKAFTILLQVCIVGALDAVYGNRREWLQTFCMLVEVQIIALKHT